jgi:hypothetical protein
MQGVMALIGLAVSGRLGQWVAVDDAWLPDGQVQVVGFVN